MERKHLTSEQAATVIKAIGPTMIYLHNLTERMLRAGFVPSDDVLAAAFKAKDALQSMRMSFHYAGVEMGLGEPAEQPPA